MNLKTRRTDEQLTFLILGWVEAVADFDFQAAELWLALLDSPHAS